MRLTVFVVLLAGVVLVGAERSETPQAASAVAGTQETTGSSGLPARRLPLLADRRYNMHAGIRPLYVFWIRRDNVGSARFCWRQGPDGSRGYEMTVGWIRTARRAR